MYSSKNIVKVIEELGQFDYVLKKLFKVHKEYYLLLEEKDNLESEEWFEKADVCLPSSIKFILAKGYRNWRSRVSYTFFK